MPRCATTPPWPKATCRPRSGGIGVRSVDPSDRVAVVGVSAGSRGDVNYRSEGGAMKQLLLFAVLLVVAGGVQAQSNTPKPHPGAGGPRSDLASEATIRKLYADFIAAWNAHDPKKMASYWALDGDTIEPDGMVAKGRAELEKHFAEEQATAMKDSTLKLT